MAECAVPWIHLGCPRCVSVSAPVYQSLELISDREYICHHIELVVFHHQLQIHL